jgi:FkbM family methyltransferase
MRRLLYELRTTARLWLTPPRSAYLGDHTLVAALGLGGFIYLDSRDLSVTPQVALFGTWEPGITRAFCRLLRPGMTVVDVGANCGVYALLAAREVGAAGAVTAIEPNPRMVELLTRTFAANSVAGWARVVQGAVMDREGEIELGIPGALYGSASVLVRAAEDRPEPVSLFKAQGKPLDRWLTPGQGVDVLKIDAEGAEPQIWDGAQAVLAANRRLSVLMEFCPPMIGSTGSPSDFLAKIRGQGFAVRSIDIRTGHLAEASDQQLLERRWSELLLTRGQ